MFIQDPKTFVRGAGMGVLLAGLAVWIGWAFEIESLKSVFSGLVTMKANTAFGLALSGLSLALLAQEKRLPQRLTAALPAFLVTALGALSLSEYFFGWNLGIDEFFFRDRGAMIDVSQPGRMSPSSAFCFILVGSALGFAATPALPRLRSPLLAASGSALLWIGGVALLGQISNALFHFRIWNYFGMAMHTALAFALLGGGLLVLARREGELRWNLERPVSIGFLVAIAIMLTAAGASWDHTNHLERAALSVSRIQEALRDIAEVKLHFSELENSERGYVLSGQESLLTPRAAAMEKIHSSLAELRKHAETDSELPDRLAKLESLIARSGQFQDRVISARQKEGLPGAQRVLEGANGQPLTSEIDELLGVMQDAENAQLVHRRNDVQTASTATFLLLPIGVFLSLTILSTGLFLLNTGVGERLATEEKLKVSLREVSDLQQQFRTMVDAIPQLAWTASANGAVFWYNQRWYDYTGTTPAEMEGDGWQKLHDPALLPKVMERWKDSLSTGFPFEMEFPLRAADGHYGWFLTRVLPFRDSTGKITHWFGTNTDLSQKRAAEEQIQQLNLTLEHRVAERTAQLELANKELEAFSYSVSHDLRAPLRAVDGFSHAVLEDYGPLLPSEGRRYLQTVRDGAQRMGALIDDLLAFSRLSRATLTEQSVKVDKLVKSILVDVKAEQPERVISIQVGDLPPCRGDSSLLRQAWTNLISNAFKYTRPRGDGAEIEIGCQRGPETIYFIRDNGAGFDMRYAHKLFGVFQRLHRADQFEGTGVGLAIVQRVIHRHGGRIWAEAALDRGATFYFTLKEENPT